MIASEHAESVSKSVDDVVSMAVYNYVSSANWWCAIPNVGMILSIEDGE